MSQYLVFRKFNAKYNRVAFGLIGLQGAVSIYVINWKVACIGNFLLTIYSITILLVMFGKSMNAGKYDK